MLFLVDRNNLGKQEYKEFEQYRSRHTNYRFPEEYPVRLLNSNRIDPSAKGVITTIERLYSILKGEPEHDDADEPATALLDRLRAAKSKAAPPAAARRMRPRLRSTRRSSISAATPCRGNSRRGRLNRTKIQKFGSVLQAYCGVEIVERSRHDQYGPHAPEISEMEAVCGQCGYFTRTENPKGAKGHEYESTPGPNAEAGRAAGPPG